MAIIAAILATTPMTQPFDYWKYRSTWDAIYEADEERALRIIAQRENYEYDARAMNLFLKAYLIYRIEVKSGNNDCEAMIKGFKEVDRFVEYLTLD